MRIYIKENTGKKFSIFIPSFLVGGTISLANFALLIGKPWIKDEFKQYVECVDLNALKKSFNELKSYKGLKLVSVKSSDGEEVEITI